MAHSNEFTFIATDNDQVQPYLNRQPESYTFPFLFQEPSLVVVDHQEKMCNRIHYRHTKSVTFRFSKDVLDVYIGEHKMAVFVKLERQDNHLIYYDDKSIALSRKDQQTEKVSNYLSLQCSSMMPKVLEETFIRFLLQYCLPTFRDDLFANDYRVEDTFFEDHDGLLPKRILLPSVEEYQDLRQYWNQDVEHEIVFCFINFDLLALDKNAMEQLMVGSNGSFNRRTEADSSGGGGGGVDGGDGNPTWKQKTSDFLLDSFLRASQLLAPAMTLLGLVLKRNPYVSNASLVLAQTATIATIIKNFRNQMGSSRRAT